MVRIISAFPGTGKSYYYNNTKSSEQLKVYDSDSSQFSWLEPGVRNPNFVTDYVDHLVRLASLDTPGTNTIILASSHQEVRDELAARVLNYYLIYPDRDMKTKYLEKFKERGSPEGFIKLMDEKWDDMVDSCQNDKFATIRFKVKEDTVSDLLGDFPYFFGIRTVVKD